MKLFATYCRCCGKVCNAQRQVVYDMEGERAWVGPDCFRRIKAAGAEGFTHEKTGETLFITPHSAAES